jgi:hypothetical protein
MAGVQDVNRNDLGAMVAGAVAFIASFFPYWGVSVKSSVPGFSASNSITAWHSYATVGLLLIFAGAIVIAVKAFAGDSVPTMPVGVHVLAAGLAGLGTILVIIRAFTINNVDLPGISSGVKWGAYVLFIAGIAETVFCVLGMRESGEKVAWQSSGPAAPAGPPPPSAPPTA